MSDEPSADAGLRLGTWVRAGGVTGVVTRVEGPDVTVFEPGARRIATTPADEVQVVPAAAVRVTLTADLPLPHGLGEAEVRRWVSALADPILRERALDALREAGLDAAPGLPHVELALAPAHGGEAVCFCGARTPMTGTTGRTSTACHACGRQAVPPPD